MSLHTHTHFYLFSSNDKEPYSEFSSNIDVTNETYADCVLTQTTDLHFLNNKRNRTKPLGYVQPDGIALRLTGEPSNIPSERHANNKPHGGTGAREQNKLTEDY